MAIGKGTWFRPPPKAQGPNETGFEGLAVILDNLRDYRLNKAPKAYERGVKKAAETLKKLSQKVVPVGDGSRQPAGTLKRSAVVFTEGKGFEMVASVWYLAPYAIFVHEDLTASHKPGKIAKYLERPARDNAVMLRQIIRDEIRKVT